MRCAGPRIVMLCAISYGVAAINLPVVATQNLINQSQALSYDYQRPKIRSFCPFVPNAKIGLLALPKRAEPDEYREPKPLQKLATTLPKPRPLQYNITRHISRPTEEILLLLLSKRKVTGNGGKLVLEPKTARMFAKLERAWGERLEVRWAYRDTKLNKRVGGAGKSYHIKKMAIDVVHDGWQKDKMKRFVKLAYSIGFRGFGLGRSVIHIDTRPAFFSWNYGGNTYGLANKMLK